MVGKAQVFQPVLANLSHRIRRKLPKPDFATSITKKFPKWILSLNAPWGNDVDPAGFGMLLVKL